MGAVGLEWQVVGFADFSGNADETDLMMRNVNTGVFELYDVQNSVITRATAIGAVGTEWTVAGFGAFNGVGSTDMLLRNANTGSFEVYDIINSQLTNAAPMGAVGLGWQVAGIATDPPGAASAQLAQAMASFARSNASLNPGTPAIEATATQTSSSSLLAAPALHANSA